MSDDFESFPNIPPTPTLTELNQFFVECARAMSKQPITPLILVLKASISIIVAQEAEIQKLRVLLGEPLPSQQEAAAVLADFLVRVQEQ